MNGVFVSAQIQIELGFIVALLAFVPRLERILFDSFERALVTLVPLDLVISQVFREFVDAQHVSVGGFVAALVTLVPLEILDFFEMGANFVDVDGF